MGELQAFSRVVSFSSTSAGLSYVPEFLAKTDTAVRPLPRSFSIQCLQDFCSWSSGRAFVVPGSLFTGVLTEDFEVC